MIWTISHRFDPDAAMLADRHYSRQKVGSPQFVAPGRNVVFLSKCARAYWVTSWPFAKYTKHKWAGAWICAAFRSEGAGVASEMIQQAVAATRWHFRKDAIPELGMVTFVDREKVRPTFVRGSPVWGWTFRKVGFKEVGETGSGLLALQLLPQDMPEEEAPEWRLIRQAG